MFLEPIRTALACVATAKITVAKGGQAPQLDTQYAWSVNNAGGVQLRHDGDDELRLFAAMYWKLIKDDRPDYGPFRISTLGYEYSLVTRESTELWALHWHPSGRSWEQRPHVHLGDVLLARTAPVTSKTHLVTGRMTFENAIRWAVEFGARPLRDDWTDQLTLAETPHILHRTWSGDPGIART